MILSEMQRRKKIKEKKNRDARLIECCDFMIFLYFTSYFEAKNKLCEKCLEFQASTVGRIPTREETKKMFEEAKEKFEIEEDMCQCQKEITTFKDPVVIQEDGAFI